MQRMHWSDASWHESSFPAEWRKHRKLTGLTPQFILCFVSINASFSYKYVIYLNNKVVKNYFIHLLETFSWSLFSFIHFKNGVYLFWEWVLILFNIFGSTTDDTNVYVGKCVAGVFVKITGTELAAVRRSAVRSHHKRTSLSLLLVVSLRLSMLPWWEGLVAGKRRKWGTQGINLTEVKLSPRARRVKEGNNEREREKKHVTERKRRVKHSREWVRNQTKREEYKMRGKYF